MSEFDWDAQKFVGWLLATPADIEFCETLRICGCPLAKFSGCKVSQDEYWPADGGKKIALPEWARQYARRFDSVQGHTRAEAIDALGSLAQGKETKP